MVTLTGCAVGLGCAAVGGWAVTRGLVRYRHTPGPADLVTLFRAVLVCAAAALVVDSFLRPPEVGALVVLAVVALVLDAVDGWIARTTGTVSAFGARLDGEVDAFLILVLSVYVAHTVAAWVLAMGVVRYVFGAAGWVLPWMRRELPWRHWRKVVTAVTGIVLAVAAAGVAGRPATYAGLVVALALLAESFGRDVLWLWQHRSDQTDVPRAGGRFGRMTGASR
jgi:phosphatidylglycerophosphate synthase